MLRDLARYFLLLRRTALILFVAVATPLMPGETASSDPETIHHKSRSATLRFRLEDHEIRSREKVRIHAVLIDHRGKESRREIVIAPSQDAEFAIHLGKEVHSLYFENESFDLSICESRRLKIAADLPATIPLRRIPRAPQIEVRIPPSLARELLAELRRRRRVLFEIEVAWMSGDPDTSWRRRRLSLEADQVDASRSRLRLGRLRDGRYRVTLFARPGVWTHEFMVQAGREFPLQQSAWTGDLYSVHVPVPEDLCRSGDLIIEGEIPFTTIPAIHRFLSEFPGSASEYPARFADPAGNRRMTFRGRNGKRRFTLFSKDRGRLVFERIRNPVGGIAIRQIPAGFAVRGKVRAHEPGISCEGLWVQLTSAEDIEDDPSTRSVKTSQLLGVRVQNDGSFQLGRIPSGDYLISVTEKRCRNEPPRRVHWLIAPESVRRVRVDRQITDLVLLLTSPVSPCPLTGEPHLGVRVLGACACGR